MYTLMGIGAFVLAFTVCIVIYCLAVKLSEDKELTPLQKAYRKYSKARPGSNKKQVAVDTLNRLIIDALGKWTSSRELKADYDSLVYWPSESTDEDGKPVFEFFNTRFIELTNMEEDEEDRLRAERERDAKERENESIRRIHNATSVTEAQNVCTTAKIWGLPSQDIALKKLEWLSLVAVLNARTIDELSKASDEVPSGSLAKKFVPYMHEFLSRLEVETASTVDDLVTAGNRAPNGPLPDTAMHVCFEKLRLRLKTQPITVKKVA